MAIRDIHQSGDYNYTYSDAHKPIARVGVGERVRIHCVDCFENRLVDENQTYAEVCDYPYMNPQTGPVFIDRSEIIMKESYPVQVELVLVGNLPTPCNKLRVESAEPDENGHIKVDAYTVSNPDKMCAQVLEPFIAVIPLGEYTEGTYTVSINEEINGKFQLP